MTFRRRVRLDPRQVRDIRGGPGLALGGGLGGIVLLAAILLLGGDPATVGPVLDQLTVGTEQVNLQTVYASKYVNDAKKGSVVWTPVKGVGNAQVAGSWKVSDGKGKTDLVLKINGTVDVPMPSLMKLIVVPVVEGEFEGLVDKYVDNLIFQTKEGLQSKPVIEEVRGVLASRLRFSPKDKEALSLWDTTEQFEFFDKFMFAFKTFLGIIGCLRIEEDAAGVVLPHEATMDGPRTDRLELAATTRCAAVAVAGQRMQPARCASNRRNSSPASASS